MKKFIFSLAVLASPLMASGQNKQPDIEREIMVNTVTQTTMGPKKVVVTGSAELDVSPTRWMFTSFSQNTSTTAKRK
ncbi:MAG: hypothetical protein ACKPB3_05360 [Bacteroidota bacterium]